ncbi:MAG: SPOR domain-containing protein [Proteobacteria bacterium]|nr:SPOR domain-containing protein [Pseudomonadota bacterium]MDA1059915.1 SPOR domain-containing protein [Pseudomonadota bacterium]
MKKLLFLALLLTLPACVAPPVITVASLALSGVSFVQTGKTLPDHALSSVSQRDCIMFRAARGEQICQISDLPLVATDVAFVEEPSVIRSGPVAVAVIPDKAPAMAAPVQPVDVAVLAPPAVPQVAVVAAAIASDAALFDEVAFVAHETTPAIRPAGAAFIPVPLGDIGVPAVVAARAPPAISQAESLRYLVVGSFRDPKRAADHVASLGRADLKIVEAAVHGRAQYRVVAGPYAADELANAQRAFAARGVKRAWMLRLADTDLIRVAAR